MLHHGRAGDIRLPRHGNIKNSVNLPNASLDRLAVCRLCVLHRNVPDKINTILELISARNINIEHMINKPRGGYAYTMIDLAEKVNGEITSEILKDPRRPARARHLNLAKQTEPPFGGSVILPCALCYVCGGAAQPGKAGSAVALHARAGPEQLIAAMAAPERSMSGTAKQVRPSSLSSLSMAQPRSRVSSSSANSASGSVIAFGVGG